MTITEQIKKLNIISVCEISTECTKLSYTDIRNDEDDYKEYCGYKNLSSNLTDYISLYKDVIKTIYTQLNKKDEIITHVVGDNINLFYKVLHEIYKLNKDEFYNKDNFIIMDSFCSNILSSLFKDITIVIDNNLEREIIIGRKNDYNHVGLALMINEKDKIYRIVELGFKPENNYEIIYLK